MSVSNKFSQDVSMDIKKQVAQMVFVGRILHLFSRFLLILLSYCHMEFLIYIFSGCEYGDKTPGCTTQHCPANPSLCCGTCHSGPTPTTPSQEPTTTKNKNPCKSSLTTATPTPSSTFTTTTPKSPSYVFRLTVTFMIDITDDLANNAVKESVISKVQAAVRFFFFFHKLYVFSFLFDFLT